MQAYKEKNKDKRIKIYTKVEEQMPDGETQVKKVYHHKKDSYLKAYIRSLSTKERITSNQIQPSDEIEVVINYHKALEKRQDAFIEYQDRTYAITGIDILDFKYCELKMTARSIEPPHFDSIEYRENCQ